MRILPSWSTLMKPNVGSTVSLTTMFWPLVSASSCSTARASMSWKFSVRRSPLYSRLVGSTTACFGLGRTSST